MSKKLKMAIETTKSLGLLGKELEINTTGKFEAAKYELKTDEYKAAILTLSHELKGEIQINHNVIYVAVDNVSIQFHPMFKEVFFYVG